jgi:hypothetical protein
MISAEAGIRARKPARPPLLSLAAGPGPGASIPAGTLTALPPPRRWEITSVAPDVRGALVQPSISKAPSRGWQPVTNAVTRRPWMTNRPSCSGAGCTHTLSVTQRPSGHCAEPGRTLLTGPFRRIPGPVTCTISSQFAARHTPGRVASRCGSISTAKPDQS